MPDMSTVVICDIFCNGNLQLVSLDFIKSSGV